MFIVFEGSDGSGTSTQAARLSASLLQKGFSVLHTVEPTDRPIGVLLDEILRKEKKITPDAFQFLFFADRLDHVQSTILPALQNNTIVICERYIWSSLAYGKASGVPDDLLHHLAELFLLPDYVVFLDLPPEKSMQRIEKRGGEKEIFEQHDVLQIVRLTMQELASQKKYAHNVLHLSADNTIEHIADSIESSLFPLV